MHFCKSRTFKRPFSPAQEMLSGLFWHRIIANFPLNLRNTELRTVISKLVFTQIKSCSNHKSLFQSLGWDCLKFEQFEGFKVFSRSFRLETRRRRKKSLQTWGGNPHKGILIWFAIFKITRINLFFFNPQNSWNYLIRNIYIHSLFLHHVSCYISPCLLLSEAQHSGAVHSLLSILVFSASSRLLIQIKQPRITHARTKQANQRWRLLT